MHYDKSRVQGHYFFVQNFRSYIYTGRFVKFKSTTTKHKNATKTLRY
jgi:hypothetical protein